jgi:branched-chain amino acid transport system ATP-binding protein
MSALLEVEQLEVVYQRVITAIQGVTLRVHANEIVALLGPNGAGKTTTLRAVSGFLAADDARVTAGRISVRGKPIIGAAPHALVRRGVVLIPERDKVFPSLTVRENLLASRGPAPAGQSPITLEQVLEYFPILAQRHRQLAGYLSGGERQMLTIASALLCQPRILLVDELSLGLAPLVIGQLMDMLRRLRDELGLAILLVEQNAAAALEIADRGYVIETGRIVYEGDADRLAASDDIREFYLGTAGGAGRKSYRNVKQYRRRRRWFG